MSDGGQALPQRAVRLIFEYEGEQVRLVGQYVMDSAVTGADLSDVDHPGYYVETRDAGGDALARVPARHAFTASAEVFPEEHSEPITRVDVEPKGAFTVVAPLPEAASQVAVVRLLPPDPNAPTVAAGATSDVPGRPQPVEIGTFALDLGDAGVTE